MSKDPLVQIAKDVSAIKSALAAGAAAFAAALGVQVASHASRGGSGPTPMGGGIANESELDSQYGDPEVKRDPSSKYWDGQSCVGMRLSECPPDYLDAFAKYKDACAYQNDKDGGDQKKKYASYDRKDAARARGWALRIRNGWKPKTGAGGNAPVSDEDYDDGGSDDIPF